MYLIKVNVPRGTLFVLSAMQRGASNRRWQMSTTNVFGWMRSQFVHTGAHSSKSSWAYSPWKEQIDGDNLYNIFDRGQRCGHQATFNVKIVNVWRIFWKWIQVCCGRSSTFSLIEDPCMYSKFSWWRTVYLENVVPNTHKEDHKFNTLRLQWWSIFRFDWSN